MTSCYEGQGWHVDERLLAGDDELVWVEVMLSKPTGEQACLAFSLATADGRPLSPSAGLGNTRIVDRLSDVQTVQVQAFAEARGTIDGPMREEVRDAFRTAMDCWCNAQQRSVEPDAHRGGSHG